MCIFSKRKPLHFETVSAIIVLHYVNEFSFEMEVFFMYNIGEYVACGNKGACKIDQITTLDISGVDKDEKYYILKPVYSAASTVYIPVAPFFTYNGLVPLIVPPFDATLNVSVALFI